jgi:hypothetical protein
MATRPREPHYASVLRELIRRHGDQIRPGRFYEVQTAHDAWCAFWSGGVCNCEPVCTLIEREVERERGV